MSLFVKLARQGFWLFLSRIGALALTVIATYLLAHRLGTAGFGQYAFIAAVVTIGNMLTTFGSDMYLIREIAAKADFSELPLVLGLQLILSVIAIGLTYGIAPHLPNQTAQSTLALRVYSLALIPLAFFTVFTSILRGAQKLTAYAWISVILPLLQVIAIIVFIQRETSIVRLAYLLLGVQTLATIFAGAFCVPFLSQRQREHFSLTKLRSMLGACLPIALIAIVGVLYQKLSLTMLSVLGAASLVGLFSAAARVTEAARLGHVTALTALYPVMANANEEAPRQGLLKLAWLFLLAISLLGSVFLFALAKSIVAILFGAEYQPSVVGLKILAFTLIPYTVNSFLSLSLLAQNREKTVAQVFVVSLLLLFALNLWFIPRAGLAGASWAMLGAESIQSVLFLLAWKAGSFRMQQGAPYELPDLP